MDGVNLTINTVDIAGGVVEFEIRHDGKVVWLSVNGRTVARVSQIKELHVIDHRGAIQS